MNFLAIIRNIVPLEIATLEYIHEFDYRQDTTGKQLIGIYSSFKVTVSNLESYKLPTSDLSIYKNTHVEAWLSSKEGRLKRHLHNIRVGIGNCCFFGETPELGPTAGYFELLVDGPAIYDLIRRLLKRENNDDENYIFFRITGLPVKDSSSAPTIADSESVFTIKDMILVQEQLPWWSENPVPEQESTRAPIPTTETRPSTRAAPANTILTETATLEYIHEFDYRKDTTAKRHLGIYSSFKVTVSNLESY